MLVIARNYNKAPGIPGDLFVGEGGGGCLKGAPVDNVVERCISWYDIRRTLVNYEN